VAEWAKERKRYNCSFVCSFHILVEFFQLGEALNIESLAPDIAARQAVDNLEMELTELPAPDPNTGVDYPPQPKKIDIPSAADDQLLRQIDAASPEELHAMSQTVSNPKVANTAVFSGESPISGIIESAKKRGVLEEFALADGRSTTLPSDSKLADEKVEQVLEPLLSLMDKTPLEGDYVIDAYIPELDEIDMPRPGETIDIEVDGFTQGFIPEIASIAETPEERFTRIAKIEGNATTLPDVRDSGRKTYNGQTIYLAESMDSALALFREGHHVDLGETGDVSAFIDDLSAFSNYLAGNKLGKPTFNLCALYKVGSNIFCSEHQGIDRLEMPQLSGRAATGDAAAIRAWKSGLIPGNSRDAFNGKLENPTITKDEYIALGNRFRPDSDNPLSEEEKKVFFEHTDISQVEPDLTGNFVEFLGKIGVGVSDEEDVDPRTLKATQQELQGSKVLNLSKATGGYVDQLDAGETTQEEFDRIALNASILISSDGYILDGHHRVFGKIALNVDRPQDKQIAQRVRRVDMTITELLEVSRVFQDHFGIAAASANPNAPGALVESDVNIVPDIDAKEFGKKVTEFDDNYVDLVDALDRETFFKPSSPGMAGGGGYANAVNERRRWSAARRDLAAQYPGRIVNDEDDVADLLSSIGALGLSVPDISTTGLRSNTKLSVPRGASAIIGPDPLSRPSKMIVAPGKVRIKNNNGEISAEVISQIPSDELLDRTEQRLGKAIDRADSDIRFELRRVSNSIAKVKQNRIDSGLASRASSNRGIASENVVKKNVGIRRMMREADTELFQPSAKFIEKNSENITDIDEVHGTTFSKPKDVRYSSYRSRLSESLSLLRNIDETTLDEEMEIPESVQELLNTRSDEQIEAIVDEFARRFHQGIEKAPRVRLSPTDLETVLENGGIRRIGEPSSLDMLHGRMDVVMGFDEEIENDAKPILGEIRHIAHDISAMREIRKRGTNGSNRFYTEDSDVIIGLDGDTSGRTAYSYKDFLSKDSAPAFMNTNQDIDIQLAVTDISKDGSSNAEKVKNLAKILETAIDTRHERMAGPISSPALQAHIAGGFELSEVRHVEYPLSLLPKSVSDRDPIIGKTTITDRLRKLGLNDAEIDAFFAQGGAIGGGLAAPFSQRLIEFRRASEVKQAMRNYGITDVRFTNPDGIDIFNPASYKKSIRNTASSAEKIIINEALMEVQKLLGQYAEKTKKARAKVSA
jgi:hypothetical protein